MKNKSVNWWVLAIIIPLSIIGSSCRDNSTEVQRDYSPRLVLSADVRSGQAPLTVNFTGTFLGKIDTVYLQETDFVMFYGTGKIADITAVLNETYHTAKSVYYDKCTYDVGTYKAVMILRERTVRIIRTH